MTKIKDILTLDLHEDIKNVIDLEDRSENEIQNEIQNYIVTEGLARYLDTFLKEYTSNLKETGVWLSGFYGSGKSYFGKMLGYLLANPNINGTPARDRFIPRLKGVSNESFIENAIRSLDAINSRVIFLDVAKQNTDKGLAFTLFANLLKQLGFRDDIYGYMEWDLFLDGKLDEFKKIVDGLEKQPWDEVKRSNRRVAKVMRAAYSKLGYTEIEYQDTQQVYSEAIENFSASKFREVLEHYLKQHKDETLVFIFDEASEAISQKKFSLLDLEGISEALSSITSKVWTIAIAQEKLDDVISNANVSRSQLTKVTDRYKTKIHLESTEVDVIIRNRLLKKKASAEKDLTDYYQKNQGQITDATNLKSAFPTQTNTEAEFAAYYPFHEYQFKILQKFLFSSNALVATQIAARGMIITAFDVLRRQMKDAKLFDFTPGHAICTEAQTAPPVALASKYDTAKQILANNNIPIAGDLLLKTIHLLVDSEVVYATVENITKSYIADISAYYDVKPDIEKALNLLVESKVLLVSNNHYKITSDLEGKLLEEMRDYQVELFVKKRELTNLLKEYKLFYNVATYSDGSDTFKFSVLTDQGDDLAQAGSPDLRLTGYSLFNIGDNRQDHIEQVKMSTQSKKDEATLIPENKAFDEIDKLITEVKRYEYMEEKYSNEADQTKRQIIREFRVIREEKAKHLRRKIEAAYNEGALVYLFNEQLLNEQKFKSEISDTQKKIIKNIYTKRLPSQLSESIVSKVFRAEKKLLAGLFSGPEFTFFDGNGNFVGESLKVVDAIQTKINSQHIDGRSLEDMLRGAPWAYSFGTIVTTLAVLLRAGRLTVKHNGQ
ncbi:MAG: BREX system P-loop protein BrxC, partial [FCB group bacterium]|nr:BREX system P-loop protein BrxC [FCB group bacterium]